MAAKKTKTNGMRYRNQTFRSTFHARSFVRRMIDSAFEQDADIVCSYRSLVTAATKVDSNPVFVLSELRSRVKRGELIETEDGEFKLSESFRDKKKGRVSFLLETPEGMTRSELVDLCKDLALVFYDTVNSVGLDETEVIVSNVEVLERGDSNQ